MMLETVIALVFAHVLADFMAQTRAMIAAKRQPPVFALHIACVAIFSGLALGARSLDAAAAIVLVVVSHAVCDALKIHPRVDARAAAMPFGALQLFALDQIAHLVFIGLAALLWPGAFAHGFWPALLTPEHVRGLLIGFVFGGGFWLATRVGDLMLALLMAGFHRAYRASDGDDDSPQMPGAGAWIGWLERTLVFLFVLLGQFNAIGFVIAAKSILRFQYAREPRISEIVIIGTLASFGWAIIVALLTHAAFIGLQTTGR
ncbi:DUF3307 domain-containing protein [Salinisphaera hydrothermalis]|uniref:DUF3307 domain-containing protein n=1 Tax=Salinisphaera hydrothermalis (strain C41B8) TaxID=1304275 RepID=A0A084IHC9_SALHC|nr:DUF3307 domain-containing protein [Salinisphaera hydrothermalis]KEZ76113.1 hypothetical protein C41B8_16604 [Salinisphaera hydrothermalis C41B8]